MLVTVMYSFCFGNLELQMAGSPGGHSPTSYSLEKSGAKPLKEAVEQTGEIERGTITGVLDAAEEEATDDESDIEDHESEGKEVCSSSRRQLKDPLISVNRLKNSKD